MGLIMMPGPASKNKKVCLHEVRELEDKPMTWVATGRRLYVDRDAPLNGLHGWLEAQRDGEGTVRESQFTEVAKRVDQRSNYEDFNDDA